jgi:hypothetical protein
MSPASAGCGAPGNASWIRDGACSSMRQGRPPTWRAATAAARAASAWSPPCPWPLADHHLRRRAARERHRRAAGARWSDDRPGVLRLRRAVPGAGAGTRRRRGARQPRRAQGRRRPPGARRGRRLAPLPASPDLNPIEQLFAKLKALLRKAAARTKDELWQAIGRLIAAVPPRECANYLSHCGYGST